MLFLDKYLQAHKTLENVYHKNIQIFFILCTIFNLIFIKEHLILVSDTPCPFYLIFLFIFMFFSCVSPMEVPLMYIRYRSYYFYSGVHMTALLPNLFVWV